MSTATKETIKEEPLTSLSDAIGKLDAEGKIDWTPKAQQGNKAPVTEPPVTEIKTEAIVTETKTEDATPITDVLSKVLEKPAEKKVAETAKLKPEEDPNSDVIHPDLPKTTTKEANHAFKLKEQRIKQLEREGRQEDVNKIKELTAELEKAKAAPTQVEDVTNIKTELETTKKQLEEYESELKVVRVESTKEFKKLVSEPLAILTQQARSFATKTGIEYKEIEAAVLMADPIDRADALDKLGAELTPAKSTLLMNLANQIADKTALKSEMLAKASETLKIFEANRAQQEEAVKQHITQQSSQNKEQSLKQYRTEAESVWKSLSEGNPFFKSLEGDKYKDYNADLAKIKNDVVSLDFDSLPVQTKAATAMLAARVPQLMSQVSGLVEENQKLTARLAGINKSAPSIKSGSTDSTDSTAKPKGLLEFLDEQLGAGK